MSSARSKSQYIPGREKKISWGQKDFILDTKDSLEDDLDDMLFNRQRSGSDLRDAKKTIHERRSRRKVSKAKSESIKECQMKTISSQSLEKGCTPKKEQKRHTVSRTIDYKYERKRLTPDSSKCSSLNSSRSVTFKIVNREPASIITCKAPSRIPAFKRKPSCCPKLSNTCVEHRDASVGPQCRQHHATQSDIKCSDISPEELVSKCTLTSLSHNEADGSQTERSTARGSLSPLHTEFLYYSATLKEIAPQLTEEKDRQKIIPWLKKLFRPEYMTNILQEKRNKYLMFMCLSILNDEAYNILCTIPPSGAVPDIEELPIVGIKQAEWEKDTTWNTYLRNCKNLACSVHTDPKECQNDHTFDKLLDDEFSFLLYLARPYAFLLRNSQDKMKIESWFQKLCKVHASACSTMRGMRNDYMMALLGYLQDLQIAGPFQDYPDEDPLKPLSETAKISAEQHPILDPTGTQTQAFLSSQPVPEDGAFCYLALTGELLGQMAFH